MTDIFPPRYRIPTRLVNITTTAMNRPKCRYIYNPVQIAECGGPCEQGPEHCDCGELWVTEPGAPTDEELILTYAFAVAAAVDAMCEPLKPEEYKRAQLAGLRAVLARWGNHPGSPDRSGNLKAGLTRSPAAADHLGEELEFYNARVINADYLLAIADELESQ